MVRAFSQNDTKVNKTYIYMPMFEASGLHIGLQYENTLGVVVVVSNLLASIAAVRPPSPGVVMGVW